MSEYKTAKEWGLFYGDGECWVCGHQVYEGKEKCHGFQEPPNEKPQLICSICLQVQMTINKDSLHKEGCNGSPFVRMFLCDPNMKRIGVWEVLDHEPWLNQIQKLPPKEGVKAQ